MQGKKLVIVILIVLTFVIAFLIVTKPSSQSQENCGDGICGPIEQKNNLCLQDCQQSCQNEGELCGGILNKDCCKGLECQLETDSPESQGVCVNEEETQVIIYNDSPFGIHPAHTDMQTGRYIEAEDMGVTWHRPSRYMFWFLVQSDLEDPTLDFSFYDEYYGAVPSSINILGNIAPTPKTIGDYVLPRSWLPIDEQQYRNFVRAGVERYDGDGIDDMPGLQNPILYWQVGNEPNDRGKRTGFAQLQKITYQEIKEACSYCKVMIGGVAQPSVPTKGFIMDKESYFLDFADIYEPYLSELNGYGFDVFDFHWYGDAEGDYRMIGPVYDELKVKLENYGFGDVPIWITEIGSYSGTPIDEIYNFQSEKQQAADYLKRFVYPLSIGVEKIFPAFGLLEGFKQNDGYFDHTGFIYDGKFSDDLGRGVKKLSYYTYKKMTEKLEGSDWSNIETVEGLPSGVYAYRFNKGGEDIWVAWNDNSESQTILLSSLGISGSVKITEAVPKYDTGLEVADYSTAFNVYTSSEEIALSDIPVFIEEE